MVIQFQLEQIVLANSAGAVGRFAFEIDCVDNSKALESLRRFQQHPSVAFREETPSLEPIWHQLAERSTVSPKVWMDAYLAAFAITGGLRLITFDKDFKSCVAAGLDLLLLEK